MKIYVAGPITGQKLADVLKRWDALTGALDSDFIVLSPLVGKMKLFRTEKHKTFKSKGYTDPFATDQAITGRDHWMVHQCDILLVDLRGTDKVSIGAISEIAWAHAYNKHIIVVMEADNIHQHAFIDQQAHVVLDDMDVVIEYLKELGASLNLKPRPEYDYNITIGPNDTSGLPQVEVEKH